MRNFDNITDQEVWQEIKKEIGPCQFSTHAWSGSETLPHTIEVRAVRRINTRRRKDSFAISLFTDFRLGW